MPRGLELAVSGAAGVDFGPFQRDHADALLSWASTRDELLQWTGPHFTFPLDRRQLHDYASSASENRQLISGTCPSTGAVVAHAELNVLPDHDLGQLRRIAVAPEERGNGVGRALVQWVVEFGFSQLRLNRLELVVFSFNEPARRCYEAVGFRQEGYSHEARKSSKGYWDLVQMGLLYSWYRESPSGVQGDVSHST